MGSCKGERHDLLTYCNFTSPCRSMLMLRLTWLQHAEDTDLKHKCRPYAGAAFLETMEHLRDVFLQECAVLQDDWGFMPWFRHPVFESSGWETFKMQVLQEHEVQGAPEGWVTGQPEMTEVLKDIRHSSERTQASIADLQRSVAFLEEKCRQGERVQEQLLREIQELRRLQNRPPQVVLRVASEHGDQPWTSQPPPTVTHPMTSQPPPPVTQVPLTPSVPTPGVRPVHDSASEQSTQPVPERTLPSCGTTGEEIIHPTTVRPPVPCLIPCLIPCL